MLAVIMGRTFKVTTNRKKGYQTYDLNGHKLVVRLNMPPWSKRRALKNLIDSLEK